jgi:branched-chain amino acid transport system permease protein
MVSIPTAVGINIDRHLLMLWGATGTVSGLAGMLWALTTGGGVSVALIGLKVFPIVILGGLDSIAGTFAAALAMGIIESLASGYLDNTLGSGFGGIAPYVCLLVALTLWPYGLFGQTKVERV